MIEKLRSGRIWVIASFAAFSILVMSGWTYWDRQTEQNKYYLFGRLAYISASYDLAVEYFDRSFGNYQDALMGKQDFYTAPPSLEQAELAQHFKALALIKMGNSKLAVITFKEALKLTTEEALSHMVLFADELKKVKEDRRSTQIDLEILFQQKPQMAKQEGKGKGTKPSDEQQDAPPQSGNQAGKSDRDQL